MSSIAPVNEGAADYLMMGHPGNSSEKICIREDEQTNAHDSEDPKHEALLLDHPQVDQEESQSIKGMKDEHQKEKQVKGPVLMKSGQPGEAVSPPHQGIAGEDFQSDENQ